MNTTDNTIDNATSQASERLQAAIDRWLETNARVLREWRVRSRGRRALADMEDHRLADIGIDRSEARDEAAKPFWKA